MVRFEPPMPAGPKRKGSCFTFSVAAPGRGYRCMAGNEIYDPCFRMPGHFGAVVCGADPFGQQIPFAMVLTSGLPEKARIVRQSPVPWLVELADGTRCARMTGTLAAVAGEPVAFGCWQPLQPKNKPRWPAIGLFDDFSRGKAWTVTKVVFVPSKSSERPFDLIDRKRAEVRTVWW